MLTHSLLRGFLAATAFVWLWLPATSSARAQEILKELEQSDGRTNSRASQART